MSFSRGQQPEFRKLLRLAWVQHCEGEGIVPIPATHDRDWYEQELFYAVGKTSTTECDAGRDYDRVMAHFEALGRVGIKWQMKLHSGDAVRVMHNLREAVGQLADEAVDEDYLRSVAQRALRSPELPELKDLTKEQIIFILGEVKRWLRRKREHIKPAPVASETAPLDRIGTREDVVTGRVEAPF